MHERIGRLKAQCRGIGKYYEIEVIADAKKEKAVDVRWKRKQKEGSMMALPGVYSLRKSKVGSDVETLWRTYSRLTDLEAVFCSLKSELGLRPIHLSKAQRADGHLFITVIAYQAMPVIRRTAHRARHHGKLRDAAEGSRRPDADHDDVPTAGQTLHVRKTTASEGLQRAIYAALGVGMKAGGLRKATIWEGLEIHFEAEYCATRRFLADPNSWKINALF